MTRRFNCSYVKGMFMNRKGTFEIDFVSRISVLQTHRNNIKLINLLLITFRDLIINKYIYVC